MTNAEMKEKVLQAIKAMNADVLCYTYNEFCNETGIGNGAYSMDEVDEIFLPLPTFQNYGNRKVFVRIQSIR